MPEGPRAQDTPGDTPPPEERGKAKRSITTNIIQMQEELFSIFLLISSFNIPFCRDRPSDFPWDAAFFCLQKTCSRRMGSGQGVESNSIGAHPHRELCWSGWAQLGQTGRLLFL